jgi:hypothetical protein
MNIDCESDTMKIFVRDMYHLAYLEGLLSPSRVVAKRSPSCNIITFCEGCS